MTKKLLKRIACILAAAVISVMPILLGGCSFFDFGITDDVSFARSSVNIGVGETYDLSDIIVSASNRYTLSVTSGSGYISLSGTKITGKATGTAVVTAETFLHEATLRVRVTEPEPDALSVEYDGALVQAAGFTSEIVFSPITGGSVSNGNIDWLINGELDCSLAASAEFEFTPTAAGEYVVRAESGALYAEHVVRVYYAVDAALEYSGEIEQSEAPYTRVTFTASVERDSRNPDDYIEWFIDGELVKAGVDKQFVYNPTAGRHTLKMRANGAVEHTKDMRFVGSITPSAPVLEFDNLYPHAYVKHDAKGMACVEITSPSGEVTEYSQADAKYSALFSDKGFDAGELISLCAQSQSRRVYRFRVKSLGDDDALAESGYSPYYTFTQLPQTAKKYLESRYFDRDYYITSEYEFVNLFEYNVIYRSKTTSKPRISYECYIAFEPYADAEDMWTDAFEIAATSGLYTGIDVDMKANVFTAAFTVDTVNTPSKQTITTNGERNYAKQLHAIIPHINYDEDKYRASNYVFPIDMLENTQSVVYTDELYLAAENNTRPVPKKGSAAETVYELARDVLRKICTDDMTDEQKAHAIYDWVMWQVTYDTPATEIEDGGETYSAYYLEGVFGDGKTSIGGKMYEPYAVCDGMSKAYSLMCNIEGIPCVRVAGEAGSSMSEAGGHAWNKVFVNGGWYVVDCTWGDSVGDLRIGFVTETYELGLHDHLFLTDAQADETHFEPYELGDSTIIYAPETPARGFDIYKSLTYNGVTIDCRVAKGQDAEARLSEIATAFAEAYEKRSTINVPGGVNGGVYSVNYEGFEIALDKGVSISENAARSAITSAVKAVKKNADVKVFAYETVLIVLVKE